MRVRLIAGPRGAGRNERGAVALIVGSLALALLVITAMVTDFGIAYVNKRHLQNGVDAVVLAVGQEVAEEAPLGSDCDELADRANTKLALADSVFRSNMPDSTARLKTDGTGLYAACNADNSMVLIGSASEQKSPTIFGGVIGQSGIDIEQRARAVLATAEPLLLRPFAVCKTDVDALMANPVGHRNLIFNDQNSLGSFGCGTGPGNWGFIDLDNDQSGGTNDVSDWIQYGYNGVLSSDWLIPQTGSFGGSYATEMAAILGKEIPLPVFDEFEGQGSSSGFHIVGYVNVTICAYDLGGGTEATDPCHQPTLWAQRTDLVVSSEEPSDSAATESTSPAPSPSGPGNSGDNGQGGDNSEDPNGNTSYIQVTYGEYVEIGDPNEDCAFGDTSCDFGSRVVLLDN